MKGSRVLASKDFLSQEGESFQSRHRRAVLYMRFLRFAMPKFSGKVGKYTWQVEATDAFGSSAVYTPSNAKIPVESRFRWEVTERGLHSALKKAAKAAAVAARMAGVP